MGQPGREQDVNTPESNSNRFYELVWPERSTVLRTAMLITHNTGKAEEIAQEALVKAWRCMHQFDETGGNLMAWLLTILRHTWVDRLRSDSAHMNNNASLDQLCESGQDPADTDAVPDTLDIRNADAMMETFSDQTVIAALKSLPDDMRWTVLLVDVVELSYELAAEVLGVPVGTVRSRVSRAREALRRRLSTLPEAIADESA